MDALRSVFEWLVDHTYLVVFVGTVIDATGLPFPGRLLLAAAGAVAASGDASVLLVIVLGGIGAMLVDQLWYLALRRGSDRLIALYYRMSGRARDGEEYGEYFRRYAAATIIAGRFFTSVRVLAWPFAAAHSVGYRRFVVLDALGAIIWASTWVLLGWFVGAQWPSAAASAGGWTTIIGAFAVAALAAPLTLRLWRRRARARAAAG